MWVKQFDRYDVMVWAEITAADRTELVKFESNVDAVVNLNYVRIPRVFLFFKTTEIFVQTRQCKAIYSKRFQSFLKHNKIALLDYRAKLPDMSPIEHMWDALARLMTDFTRFIKPWLKSTMLWTKKKSQTFINKRAHICIYWCHARSHAFLTKITVYHTNKLVAWYE